MLTPDTSAGADEERLHGHGLSPGTRVTEPRSVNSVGEDHTEKIPSWREEPRLSRRAKLTRTVRAVHL